MNCNLLQEVESDVVDLYSDNSNYYLTNTIIKNPNITDATYNFCCIYDTFDVQTLTGVYNISTTNPMFTDEPNHDYSLLKGSPLIGNGFDLFYCDYSVSNWNQDLLTISDLTREIGAYSYDFDRYASYTFTDDPGYNWVSFPVVDNEPQSNAIMANFFAEYSLPNSDLLRLKAQTDNGLSLDEPTFTPNYLSQTEIIDSRKGYKLRFSQASTMNRFHGYHIAPDAYVEVPYHDQDTWIGYFLTQTQKPADAFGAYLDELYYIQHKDWTMVREMPKRGAPWIFAAGIGGVAPSLSYGDMVNVKRFASTNPENEHFQWCLSSQSRAYSTSQTNYFQFEEEADYTPIFVEIDSTLGIKEVAIYANEECKGAAVVENNLVMIHGYLSDVANGTELELRTWDNSRKVGKVDVASQKLRLVVNGDRPRFDDLRMDAKILMVPLLFEKAQKVTVTQAGIGIGRRCGTTAAALHDTQCCAAKTQIAPDPVEFIPCGQIGQPDIGAPAFYLQRPAQPSLDGTMRGKIADRERRIIAVGHPAPGDTDHAGGLRAARCCQRAHPVQQGVGLQIGGDCQAVLRGMAEGDGFTISMQRTPDRRKRGRGGHAREALTRRPGSVIRL